MFAGPGGDCLQTFFRAVLKWRIYHIIVFTSLQTISQGDSILKVEVPEEQGGRGTWRRQNAAKAELLSRPSQVNNEDEYCVL